MKKHITRLLCAALLLLALCIGASAAETSGKCGPSAYWSFDNSYVTLTISGSGAMDDYESENEYPWKDYRDRVQIVVIGDQITQIGRNAFASTVCHMIKFGENVRSIGDNAFYNCPLSGDLVIPDSVTSIGSYAFYINPYLYPRLKTQGTLTLGRNLRSIGESAFCESRYTGSLTIPDSVVEIGERAFYKCENLNGTLTLGKSLRTIGKEAFYWSAFTGDLTIPEGVTEIADGAFSSLYQYRDGMFNGTLTLPSTLRTIGANAFSFGDFSGELLIPDGVTSIGEDAFVDCDGFVGTLSLPDSVKTVGEGAFYGCKGFTSLKLSAGLTKIETNSFAEFGTRYGLKTEVVIPEGVTEIDEDAFRDSRMWSVRLPSTLKNIEDRAFFYAGLSKVTLSDGLETIGDEAFFACHFINAVILPASIKSIGKKAFDREWKSNANLNELPVGVYFLGAAPQIVGTPNDDCSFPSDWTLYYLPGTSGWTGDTYAGYKIALWDGETRWDNPHTRRFGYDVRGYEIETSWSVNTDTGKVTLTDDLNEGCVVAVSYDAEGRVTSIGVLRTKKDFVILNLQDTCRLFLLNASSAPRLNTPVTINDYLQT